MPEIGWPEFERRRQALLAARASQDAACRMARRDAPGSDADARTAPIRLAKNSSNLFRDRDDRSPRQLVDLRAFDQVIAVDAPRRIADVGGLTTYESAVRATLRHSLMPAVVPQLKTITVGGAAAGLGIEAASFRHGLVHDNLLEIEVLLPDGSVVSCTPDNEHRDLFHGFPNSYGTLGYALRLRTRLIPVRPFVQVHHRRFQRAADFFEALAIACDPRGDADFVDGVVFSRDDLVLSVARFVDQAPSLSDYTYERIYYRSLRERELDHLSAEGYLWRWDTDWFWCSKNLGAQNPLLRRLWGRSRLNSRTYTRVMRWNSRVGLTRRWSRLRGRRVESVIQDVDIPLPRAIDYLEFMLKEVPLLPIWICPFRPPDPAGRFDLYRLAHDGLYVNFGFWDTVETPLSARLAPDHFNRMIERKVTALGGMKSLYSDSFFEPDEFWSIYGGEAYRALKARYDPRGRAPDLYRKCVLRQ